MWEHFTKPVDENGVEDFRKARCHHKEWRGVGWRDGVMILS